MGEERRKTRAYRLSRDIQRFYAEHPLSPWQKQKITEIREDYKDKQKILNKAHDLASMELSHRYMEFEIEYLRVSDRLKEENGGREPYHKDIRRFVSIAFWRTQWIVGRTRLATLFMTYGKEVN